MLPEFELLIPKTLDEALDILAEYGSDVKIVAGGTDVYVDMHGKYTSAPFIMDIKQLDELKTFSFEPGKGAVIGALTTHHFLDRSPIIWGVYPALSRGASQVGSVQIRQRGTLGGNICNAVPSGDTLGPLLALDAVMVAVGKDGEREIPACEFFLGHKKTALLPGELLKEVRLPDPGTGRSEYIKFTRRGAMDLALLGASAALDIDEEGRFKNVRISLTTCGSVPMRALEAEAVLEGQIPTEELIVKAGLAASAEAHPRSSWRCTEEYRREVLKDIVPQAIRTAYDRTKRGVGIE